VSDGDREGGISRWLEPKGGWFGREADNGAASQKVPAQNLHSLKRREITQGN
jgi:hypothetical protein